MKCTNVVRAITVGRSSLTKRYINKLTSFVRSLRLQLNSNLNRMTNDAFNKLVVGDRVVRTSTDQTHRYTITEIEEEAGRSTFNRVVKSFKAVREVYGDNSSEWNFVKPDGRVEQ
jgi:hypothetical protein